MSEVTYIVRDGIKYMVLNGIEYPVEVLPVE